MDWSRLENDIKVAIASKQKISFLVGAGLSAESGIPTFRGKDGFWKVGSKNYQPEEIGTYRMFCLNSEEVWKWFLFRKTICKNAQPNEGHLALVEIEDLLNDQFALITQNVDGLHKKAGNSLERTYYVHGDLDFVRCGDECTSNLYPFPQGISDKKRGDRITEQEQKLLKCPNCGEDLRPHVLWFDETYNEKYYKFQTVRDIADNTALLFIIGTSGATYLPTEFVDRVSFFNGGIVDINLDDNNFTEFIKSYDKGYLVRDSSSQVLPKIVELMKKMITLGKK
ncbi:Sir2 family NAD-dependent protein deacetylase [Limibacter armeniacum]|uniref:SIR2 family NAD-dependent protein deacylase n=1 Tax=Limibacter armeniacum TaxID=466084 RepID=UPI002FE6AECD